MRPRKDLQTTVRINKQINKALHSIKGLKTVQKIVDNYIKENVSIDFVDGRLVVKRLRNFC